MWNIERFGSVTFLNASSYKHFNAPTRRVYWRTSMVKASKYPDSSGAIELIVNELRGK